MSCGTGQQSLVTNGKAGKCVKGGILWQHSLEEVDVMASNLGE